MAEGQSKVLTTAPLVSRLFPSQVVDMSKTDVLKQNSLETMQSGRSWSCKNVLSLISPMYETCLISIDRKTYLDPKGVERTWESAERSTRPKGSDIDGVGIVAILDKETGKSPLRFCISGRL